MFTAKVILNIIVFSCIIGFLAKIFIPERFYHSDRNYRRFRKPHRDVVYINSRGRRRR